MSEVENPVDTVVRLLSNNMWVVKEDGSLASILVSKEWYDRELFKNYDGQMTVGLAESRDTKIEMSGRLRRRVGSLRANVWSQDMLTRQKMVEEVNRIVRQNRNKPNETLYYFAGVGQATGTHKAYNAGSATELPPNHVGWTELTNTEYEKIWYSDDQRHSKSHNVNGEYALMLFRFKIDSREKAVKKIVLAFEGYGTAPAGNGVTIKVWNHVAQAWQNAQSGTGGADETITITLTSSITDFIDDNGYVWLLARTTNPSDDATPAVLYCDYACCTVTVNGITYLDIVSYRDADRVDVKPFIFRTEFTLKSWSFEDVGGVF
ncbi:hypothetical protein G4O51_12690 [Candidatus Bathyarchaeota archaeon A05DMB-2]|jgi:hypothetical protein|nr:hypothetical protein [Candidatus Bathyarchaeota archaeon A05DMB-2]